MKKIGCDPYSNCVLSCFYTTVGQTTVKWFQSSNDSNELNSTDTVSNSSEVFVTSTELFNISYEQYGSYFCKVFFCLCMYCLIIYRSIHRSTVDTPWPPIVIQLTPNRALKKKCGERTACFNFRTMLVRPTGFGKAIFDILLVFILVSFLSPFPYSCLSLSYVFLFCSIFLIFLLVFSCCFSFSFEEPKNLQEVKSSATKVLRCQLVVFSKRSLKLQGCQ